MTDQDAAEAWAWANVHVSVAGFQGNEGVTKVARLRADGNVFERRVQGRVGHVDGLVQGAIAEVVKDYLEFLAARGRDQST
jgi:hypothetical protein